MQDEADDTLLTVAECAGLLGIYGIKSRTFVRDEIHAKKLPAIIRPRPSGRTWIRVRRVDLLAYIARSFLYTGALK